MKKIIIVLLSMLFSISAYSQLQLVSPVKHEKTNQNQKKEVILHTITAYYLNKSSKEYEKIKIRVANNSRGDLSVYQINIGYGWRTPSGVNDITESFSTKARLVDRYDGEMYDYFDYKYYDDNLGYVYFNF